MSEPIEHAIAVREGEIFDGKFRIEECIGKGGMGVVFAATHLHLHQRVALKFLSGDVRRDPERLGRFLREARAAAKLESEHVARALDFGGVEVGTPYIVLEYLEGIDLAHLIARDGPLPCSRAVDLILQACEAIAEAHARGIVHRDLKPANLFLATRGDRGAMVKVLDFGIAKCFEGEGTGDDALTQTSDVLGSPKYMSPEQLRSSRDITARADVWAIGVVLFELLTGRTPFEEGSTAEICCAILNESARPIRSIQPSIPAALELAIARCLERIPSRRTASMVELANAIVPFGSEDAMQSLARIRRWAKLAAAGPAEGATLAGADPPFSSTTGTPHSEPARVEQTLAISALGTAIAAPRPRNRAGLWLGAGALATVLAIGLVTIARPGRHEPSAPTTIAVTSPVPVRQPDPVTSEPSPPPPPAALAVAIEVPPDTVRSPARTPPSPRAMQPKPRPDPSALVPSAEVANPAQGPGCPDPMCSRK